MSGEFLLVKTDLDPRNIVAYGNMFLIGNGHIGYRGTLEEYGKEQITGLNIIGFYDRYRDKWRESLNAPNPFFVEIQGHHYLKDRPLSHEIRLNLKTAVFARKTVYSDLIIESRRTISQSEDNLLLEEYRIRILKKTHLDLTFGLDADIYEINGPHFRTKKVHSEGHTVFFEGTTNEDAYLGMEAVYLFSDIPAELSGEGRFRFCGEVDPQEITIRIMAKIYERTLDQTEQSRFRESADSSHFETLFSLSEKIFAEKWKVADVRIEGDEKAQFSMRYSIYHLLILENVKYRHSIPARGLSGQTYKGAVFWDSEIFILPFFLMTNPKMARKILEYRIHTLDGAKEKAKKYHYEGAFYSWESQDTGLEACSEYNVTDPVTNQPIRTYFNEKQIHISADIVYAFNDYLSRTKDYSLLIDGGYEVMRQVLLFVMSYAMKGEDGLYHFNDVIGPDEYHERVDDNAFTTYMNYESVKLYLKYYEILRKEGLMDVSHDEELSRKAEKFLGEIYLPAIGEDGILEQFKGYFDLEDVGVEEVRKRVRNEKEYWGSKNGVATPTRVIKQADVIALMSLQYKKFTPEMIKANYDFYNRYTEHGSSLSASMYSQCACRIGYLDEAYTMFLRSATVDLEAGTSKMFAGGIYIGGTHPASNGGSYLSVVNGFAGMTLKNGRYSFHPNLPEKIKKLEFSYYQENRLMKVTLTKDRVAIKEVQDD